MKTYLFLFLLAVVLSLAMCSKENDKKGFVGYIPAEAKPKVEWIEHRTGMFNLNTTIPVVTEKGDTLAVSFKERGMFDGSYLVLYKNSYPPAVGKKVYVHVGVFYDDYLIERASLKPFVW